MTENRAQHTTQGQLFLSKLKRCASHIVLHTFLFTSLQAPLVSAAHANPQNGQVVGGKAQISGQGTSNVTIHQSTKRAIINWDSFNVGQGETTTFVQPGKSSVAFNRVTGADPSQILGSISANGQVILANPNGVIFGAGSRVDAAGFVATTHDATNEDIMNGGKLTLTRKAGAAAGQIVNNGMITATEAGLAGLLAPAVANNGIIQANVGTVGLGAGDGFTVDFYGDRMMNFKVDKDVAETMRDINGAPLQALASNNGTLRAEGGTVLMTARAARDVVNQSINVKGTAIASSVSSKGGKIILSGSGKVAVDSGAKIEAASSSKTGGTIHVLGNDVQLSGASVDASGKTGGGTIRVGGGYQGGEGIDRAATTTVDAATTIKADATDKGNGGSVVVWSDVHTDYKGAISARGGANGGNGGDAEVSGKQFLTFQGTADLTAAAGKTGNLLLDPYDITIQATPGTPTVACASGTCSAPGNTSILDTATLLAALATGNVTVSTAGAGVQNGDITIASSFSWSSGNRLLLLANRNITINNSVVVANTFAGPFAASANPTLLVMRADAASVNNGGKFINNGTIDFSASAGAVAMYYDRAAHSGSYTAGTQTINNAWTAPTNMTVSSQFTAYQLINTVADLQAIVNATMSGNYGFGQSFGNAVMTAGTGALSGIMDGSYCSFISGSNCTLSNITMTSGDATYGGLIARTGGPAPYFRNLNAEVNLTQNLTTGTASYIGTLIGHNNGGHIANVNATGTLTINYSAAGSTNTSYFGGLVGNQLGTLYNSTASGGAVKVNITGTTTTLNIYTGGLVGYAAGTNSNISNNTASKAVDVIYEGAGGNTVTVAAGGLIGVAGNGIYTDNIANGGKVTLTNAATGTLTFSGWVGGMVASHSAGAFSGTFGVTNLSSKDVSFVQKSIYGSSIYVGGFVGQGASGTAGFNALSSGAVRAEYFDNTFAGAAVEANVGGFVGYAGRFISGSSQQNLQTSAATGSVFSNLGGGLAVNIGGFSGTTNSTINFSDSYATGNVTYIGTGSATGVASIGGFLGNSQNATYQSTHTNNYATGNVDATYTGAHATPTFNVGGYVGDALRDYFTNNYTSGGYVKMTNKATGTSAVQTNIGGFMGLMQVGRILSTKSYLSYANREVIYDHQSTASGLHTVYAGGYGGFISTTGNNYLNNISSSSSVTANYSNGGSGNVSGYLGGLIGVAGTGSNTIMNTSYSTGKVYSALGGVGTTQIMGGLVGVWNSSFNFGIRDAYSMSPVIYAGNATATVAGLVGTTNAYTYYTYATGYLSNASVGTTAGLIGNVTGSGSLMWGYWDTTTTGIATSTYGIGYNTATMQANLKSGFGANWNIIAGISYPYLVNQIASGTPQVVSGIAYSNNGTTNIGGGLAVAGLINGNRMSNAGGALSYTGADGYYYFLLPDSSISAGGSQVLTYLTETIKGSAFAHNATASVSNLSIYGNSLRIVSGGASLAAMRSGLITALGANSGANFPYSTASGITMNSGVNLYLDLSNNSTALDTTLSLSGGGVLTINSTHAVTQSTALNIANLYLSGAGGSFTLTNAGNNIGTIAANTGSISINNGANNIHVGVQNGVNGITTSGATTLVTTGGITLDRGITSGTGANITLAGSTFTNNAGINALTAGAGGRWLVWSANPSGDNRGSMAYNFKQYNATYGSSILLGTGNGFLYTVAPVFNVGLTGTVSKTYNRSTLATLIGANYTRSSSEIDGDTVTLNLPVSGTYDNWNQGSSKNVSVTGISVTGATNGSATVYGYQVNSSANANIGTILRKALTIIGSFTASDKTYNKSNAATIATDGLSLSGIEAGDNVTLTRVATFADANAGTKAVSLTGSSIAGGDVDNYTLSFASAPTATATILQKALTIIGSFTANDKTYNKSNTATIATDSLSLDGIEAGDNVTLTRVVTFVDANAGTKTVSLTSSTLGGADLGNYSLSFASAPTTTATILQKALTIIGTFTASDKTYNKSNVATIATDGLSLSGVEAGDNVVLNRSAVFADANAGTHNVTLLANITGTAADNYSLSFTGAPTATATILQKALTIIGSFTASDKTYNKSNAATIATDGLSLSGVEAGDNVTLTRVATFADANAGTKAVSLTGSSIAGGDVDNYTLSFASAPTATATILQKALTIIGSFTANDKTYNKSNTATIATDSLSLDGIEAGDNVTLTRVATFADANAGTKTVSLTSSTLGGADLGNYSLSFASAPTATATILQKALTITGIFAVSNKTYDKSNAATIVHDGLSLSGVEAGDNVTLNRVATFFDANAGTKSVRLLNSTIAGSDVGNYTLSFTGAPTTIAVILQKALTITGSFTAADKVFDGTTQASILSNNLSLQGVETGDEAGVSLDAVAAFDTAAIGPGKTVSILGSSISGSGIGNYTLSYAGAPTATAAITNSAPVPPVVNPSTPAVQEILHVQKETVAMPEPAPAAGELFTETDIYADISSQINCDNVETTTGQNGSIYTGCTLLR